MAERRLLILFAHPSLERSEINARCLADARACDAATVVDLYAEYPDYRIDIEAEQRRLRNHDVVVFLFPLYWYSTPALLKEWQDLVLEHGFAYGSEGRALEGKYFLAGVVLANSEFRHELESVIDPFKGLLLGLFFITVGAGVQFSVLAENAVLVAGLTLGVIAIKAGLLFVLALLFRIRRADGWLFALSLAQAGEFGFVLISYAAQNSVLPAGLVPVLSVVVALSMFLTPLLFIAFEKLVQPRYEDNEARREADSIDERGPVIIAAAPLHGRPAQVGRRR